MSEPQRVDDTGGDGGVVPRGTFAAALGLALVPFVALVWRFRFVCDDAFITFRYSRNLSEGHGLVYHPGVEPPVEGYSEFLWALLMGLGFQLGLEPTTFSLVLSALFGAGCVVAVVWLCARYYARSPVALLGSALVVGTAPPLAVWSTGGMATMPAACLGVLLFWALHGGAARGTSGGGVGRSLAVAALATLLALMRADGALTVALILGSAILLGLFRRERALWQPAIAGAAISAAAFGAHALWRHGFYGDWVPNTARVKLGYTGQALGRGVDYVLWNALEMPGLALAFVAGVLGSLFCLRRAPLMACALAMVLGVTAYAAAAGGDFMAFARFLVPAIPFAVIGFGALLGRVERRSRLGAGALALAAAAGSVAAAFDVHPVPVSARMPFFFRHNQTRAGAAPSSSELEQWKNMKARADEWGITGRALGVHAPPHASVVHGAVGAIGYYSNLFVYDRNGLVTREVALREPHAELMSPGHDKMVSPQFFLKYSPTFLGVGICPVESFPPVRGAMKLGETERDGFVLWAFPSERAR